MLTGKMKFVMPLIIILLTVVAVYLGKVIYDKSFSSPKGQPKATQTITPSPTQNISSQPPWLSNLSDVERSLFNIPSTQASEEEKNKHSDLILKNTYTSSELNIMKDCQPSPLAFPVDKTLSFTAKNTDSVTHTLKIGEKGQYTINPGATSTITLEKKGTILAYGCDFYNTVGFLVTAP